MAAPVVYFAGNEDEALTVTGNAAWSTTSTNFRPNLNLRGSWVCTGVQAPGARVMNRKTFGNLAAFAVSVRAHYNSAQTGTGAHLFVLLDNGQVVRLRGLITANTANVFTVQVQKVSAAGVATNLGSTFDIALITAASDAGLLQIVVNYAVAGSIDVYANGISSPIFSYTGDVTTDAATSLSFFGFESGGRNGSTTCFSEFLVTDQLLVSASLGQLVPSANGNTHDFDTGTPAAANVNETTLNDLTYDGSSVAGQIDQYTVAAPPAGTYSCLAIIGSVRCAVGASGPSQFNFGYRTGGADTWEANQAPGIGLDLFQKPVYTNAVTALPFTRSDLAAAGFNIGLRSVA